MNDIIGITYQRHVVLAIAAGPGNIELSPKY